MRAHDTPPEQLLWTALRNKQIAGLKFRRQHPIGPYFVDFYCHAVKLVIEADGMSHIDRLEYDQKRTAYLESRGFQVFRVTNEDIMRDLDAVIRGIAEAADVEWE